MNEIERWLNSLSQFDLEQIAQAGLDEMLPIEQAVAHGTDGKLMCPRCQANAKWSRTGRNWSAGCDECGWNACGALGVASIQKS